MLAPASLLICKPKQQLDLREDGCIGSDCGFRRAALGSGDHALGNATRSVAATWTPTAKR
jgi:hypothetical protein